jgi:hypothetical protein
MLSLFSSYDFSSGHDIASRYGAYLYCEMKVLDSSTLCHDGREIFEMGREPHESLFDI